MRRRRSADAAHRLRRGFVVRSDLRARLLEGVGDGGLEAQQLPVASRGVPCVWPILHSGRVEERRAEPGIDGVFGLAPLRSCGADEPRCALGVAADDGDPGESEQALGDAGRYDELAAQLELLA